MSNSPNKLFGTLFDAAFDSCRTFPQKEFGEALKHLFTGIELCTDLIQFEIRKSPEKSNYADIYGVISDDGREGLKIYSFSEEYNDERVAEIVYSIEDAMATLFKNLDYVLRNYKYLGRSDQDGLSYGKIYQVKQIDVINGIPTEMFIDDDNDLRPVTYQSSRLLSLVPQSTL